jgi:arylsulfatase A-like enzyme
MRPAEITPLRAVGLALLGGAWGGALAGLGEAVLITATAAPPDEYGLFPFAIVWYGLLGCGLGVVAVSVLGLLQGLRRRSVTAPLGVALAATVALLGFVVGRYHVAQRVFGEQLVTSSAQGVLVHAVLLLVATGVAALLGMMGRRVQRRPLAALVALLGCTVLVSLVARAAAPRVAPPLRQASASADKHPNIILIVVDTLRADAVGIHGAGPTATPNLDRLAREGVRFERAYAQSSWTRPSIATILTGLYPSAHGAVRKLDPLPDEIVTIAEALRAGGYWTAGFVSNINVAPIFNFQQGFSEYRYLAPSFYFGATDSATRLAIYKGLRVLRERLFGHRKYFYHYYQDAEVVNDAVIDWIDERPPSPFFLLVHYMDPHDPYFEMPYNGYGVARVSNPSPPADSAPELRRLYAEDVSYFDEHLGRLLQKLRDTGLYEKSIVALTADHGEELFDHGGWWHGTTLYEEQIHVPLVVRRPREPNAGAIVAQPVRTLDIVPTLLTAASIAVPAAVQGRDLFSSATAEPAVLYAEEELEGNVLAAVRQGDWKLISANAGNPRGLQMLELYNLRDDPSERRNLAATEPQRVQALLQELDRQRRMAAAPAG